MPWSSNEDPKLGLRIVRQSLISSVCNLHSGSQMEISAIIARVRALEAFVYEPNPTLIALGAADTANGQFTVVTETPAPASVGPVCAECGAPLTEVVFKKGNTWTPQYLAQQGMTKYGRLLCKQHYFGKKPAAT